MVICAGFAQGLGLVLRALASAGVSRVAFEDPGYPNTGAAVAAWAGVEAVPVRVDECGIDAGALAATGARAVVLTPAHQWPTGVLVAPERRLALVEWAARHDATIIEDDYDAEFRYDREPVGALQGLAADRVAALGTVSKSPAPSLRLGWVLCPPSLAEAVAAEKNRRAPRSPGLRHLPLARLNQARRPAPPPLPNAAPHTRLARAREQPPAAVAAGADGDDGQLAVVGRPRHGLPKLADAVLWPVAGPPPYVRH